MGYNGVYGGWQPDGRGDVQHDERVSNCCSVSRGIYMAAMQSILVQDTDECDLFLRRYMDYNTCIRKVSYTVT